MKQLKGIEQMGVSRPAIWWIRRDLRLADNQALAAALVHSGPVIPVFVLIMPLDVQQTARCQLGTDYPYPIVDHQRACQRVLEVFGSVRNAG